MAKLLSARCLTSDNTVTMNTTTLEITTAVDDQLYSFLGGISDLPIVASTFSFKATGVDLLVKLNDETDINEEIICEADIWETIDFNTSIANFIIKAEAGAKFKIRIMQG